MFLNFETEKEENSNIPRKQSHLQQVTEHFCMKYNFSLLLIFAQNKLWKYVMFKTEFI
jgi:hypothetical protein